MAIKSVVKMGQPGLWQRSRDVTEFATPELLALITDMTDTMRHYQGAGIAAPQIGCNQRVIVFGFEKNARYPHAAPVPFTILINPTFTPLSEEKVEGWEGCLSVPGLRGSVFRYRHIRYTGFDENGQTIERTAEDFHARLVQHEIDHIDGILFLMRIQDMTKFGFEEALSLKS